MSEWLANELKRRTWSMSELARRAGYSSTQVSNVISGSAKATADFTINVARALEEDPVYALRLAGHLPAVPPPTDLDRAVGQVFRHLAPSQKQAIAKLLFDLAGKNGSEYAPADSSSLPGRRPLQAEDIPHLSSVWDDVCTEMEYCGMMLLEDWNTERGALLRHFRVLQSSLARALLESVGQNEQRIWGDYVHRLLDAHQRHATEETVPPPRTIRASLD